MSQNLSDPIVYNNIIIKEQSHLIEQTLTYINLSAHSADLKEIEKSRNELIDEIRKSIVKIRKLPSFNGNSRLKNETLNVFNIYLETYEKDLLTSLSLKKKYTDSYEALQAYFEAEEEADTKLNDAVAQLTKAQERFARKNDLAIDRTAHGEAEKKMEFITNLKDYSRSIFMEYFKVSYEFNEMIKIIHERKGRLLDKKRKEVIEVANESLKSLGKAKPFNGDREYLSMAIDIIEYFKTLSEREFREIAGKFNKDSLSDNDAEFINKVFADYNANIELLVYNWNFANHKLWKDNLWLR